MLPLSLVSVFPLSLVSVLYLYLVSVLPLPVVYMVIKLVSVAYGVGGQGDRGWA